MIVLKLRSLTKSFGRFKAVNDVNLDFEKGELRCIIGPNGAGKSTLFGLISGFLLPDYGEIMYMGKEITHLQPHQRAGIGIVRKFQVPNIYDSATVRENLRIPCQVRVKGKISLFTRSSRKINKKIDQILEFIRLRDKDMEVAGEISHGEKQWLELGMALAMDPQLLLLDEPTGGMTIDETTQTAEIISELSGSATIIVIEHDIEFIRQIAHRITVLHLGAVLTEGTLSEIESDERVKNVYLGKGDELVKNQ